MTMIKKVTRWFRSRILYLKQSLIKWSLLFW